MPYVENQTIHDADSHIMEVPGMVAGYLEKKHLAAFNEKNRASPQQLAWAKEAQALQDDTEFRAGDNANILLRKDHHA